MTFQVKRSSDSKLSLKEGEIMLGFISTVATFSPQVKLNSIGEDKSKGMKTLEIIELSPTAQRLLGWSW